VSRHKDLGVEWDGIKCLYAVHLQIDAAISVTLMWLYLYIHILFIPIKRIDCNINYQQCRLIQDRLRVPMPP
jgi:hypothetical protein